tara:strand:- start:374 stop:766 length:393 start_codon:yes stop_codon:yes gene_type:complete
MSEEPIGYGKPPKKSQFKPGKSGNAKGRPKGGISLKTALRRELEAKLVVKEQGKTRKMSKLEALAKRLVTDALNGNPRALAELLRQVNLHLPDEPDLDTGQLPAAKDDAAILMAFAKRAAAEISRKEKGK